MSSATQMLAMLCRVLRSVDMLTEKIAYSSIVTPILEFALQKWDSYQKRAAGKNTKQNFFSDPFIIMETCFSNLIVKFYKQK